MARPGERAAAFGAGAPRRLGTASMVGDEGLDDAVSRQVRRPGGPAIDRGDVQRQRVEPTRPVPQGRRGGLGDGRPAVQGPASMASASRAATAARSRSSYMTEDHGGAAPRLLHVVRAPRCLRTDALQGLAMHCPRYWGIPGVTPERAVRPRARLTHLGAATPRTRRYRIGGAARGPSRTRGCGGLHDRVDDLRPQRAWQVVAHAGEDHQPGPRDRLGGGAAAGDVHERVGVAVDHGCGDADARRAPRCGRAPTPPRRAGARCRRGRRRDRTAGRRARACAPPRSRTVLEPIAR